MSRHLRVYESITGSFAAVNEDLISRSPGTLWVLDGASGLGDRSFTGETSDAAWLTHAARSVLASPACDGRPLEESLRHTIEHIRTSFDATSVEKPQHGYEWPSAAVVGVKLEGDRLHGASLGDCKLVFADEREARLTVLGGGPLEELDRSVVERMASVQQRDGSSLQQARAELAEQIRVNRSLMNTPEGYWNLSFDVRAAEHADTIEVPASDGQGLLMSDGFYRLVDTFGLYDDSSLLRAAKNRGLAALLLELRQAEIEDPEGDEHPRLKRHDDASAVLFSTGAN